MIDIDRTLEESKIKRLLKNMKAQINMGKLAELGIELAGGTVVGQKMGLDKFSGIVGAVASIINITQTLAQTPKCLSPKKQIMRIYFMRKRSYSLAEGDYSMNKKEEDKTIIRIVVLVSSILLMKSAKSI